MFGTSFWNRRVALVFPVMVAFLTIGMSFSFPGNAGISPAGAHPFVVQSGSPVYDTRLESTDGVFRFNKTTGKYQFTNCTSGYTTSGTGQVTNRGCSYTLSHIASDRRVSADYDECFQRGSAAVQVFSQSITYTIIDTNTANNVCITDSVSPQVRLDGPDGARYSTQDQATQSRGPPRITSRWRVRTCCYRLIEAHLSLS